MFVPAAILIGCLGGLAALGMAGLLVHATHRRLRRQLDARTEELRIATERADALSRHRVDFLSAMSHDLRTPLAGVIGMLKFALRDNAVRGRTEEYLRIGLQNSEVLLAVLNDILDFSRIDAGKLTLDPVSLDLRRLVTDVSQLLHGQADAKSLGFHTQIDPALPDWIEGDPKRLRQILVNLVGNAIKFTEHGEVRLQVLVDDATLLFSISDTGPGIAPVLRERLFRTFEQGDQSTTRRYGGTGLGLVICKELVEMMGGSICLDAAYGDGARFCVRLPLRHGATPPAPALERPRGRHRHQLRVLCAEDVRTNQIIIGALLEEMGHQVAIVENGVEVLHALSGGDYDLVLMDGRMPIMDGEQATRAIRAGGDTLHPVRNPRVPIFALTANAGPYEQQRYLDSGMDGFLAKPVDEARLYDEIDRLIDAMIATGRALRPPPTDDAALSAQFGVAPAAAGTSIRMVPPPGLSQRHALRITEAFLIEAPRRMQAATLALGAGDGAAAAEALHALKGSAAYLSSQQLREVAQRLETLARAGALPEARALMDSAQTALDLALRDLTAAQHSD